jgi:hypothetical protein
MATQMNLSQIYETEKLEGLKRLAEQVGCSWRYLYQCATHRKTISPELAQRCIAADARLSLDDIYCHLRAGESAAPAEQAAA